MPDFNGVWLCVGWALFFVRVHVYVGKGRKTAEWGTGIQPAAFAYDDADRLITLTTWRAKQEDITTNPTGRTDGDTTTWAYHNPSGLLTRKTYQDATHEDYQYNALNWISKKTDPRGIVTTYTWETKQGACTKIEFSDATPTQNFTYDHIGNICKIIDASGIRSIACNSYNEVETDAMAVNGNKYTVNETMDTLGRSTGYSLAKDELDLDTVAYAYSEQGRLAKASFLHGGQEKTFAYSYLPGTNLLHSIAHPNNILVTRTYEEQRELPISINAILSAAGYNFRKLL